MFRAVEHDPRDLNRARTFLSVYLLGLRDATVKFADLWGRSRDAEARAQYEALLGDLETSFGTHRTAAARRRPQRPRHRDRGAARAAATGRAHRPLDRQGGDRMDRGNPRAGRGGAEGGRGDHRRTSCPSRRASSSPPTPPTRRSRAEIERRKAEIDISSTQSIIRFGSAAQAELQAISQEMLSGVRNKDVGPAGNSPARHGDEPPRLLGRRARPEPQAELVGAADRRRRADGRVHGALRGGAGPDRQDHRRAPGPRAHAAQGHQVARQALREDPRLLRRARALHRRRRGEARRARRRRRSRPRRPRCRPRPRSRG